MTRWASTTDKNHKEIADALRSAGASVTNTHRLGQGFPDLAVGISGMTLLVEVKTETGKLTPREEIFHEEWRGQVAIVRTAEEAVRLVECWRVFGEAARDWLAEMEERR